MISDSPSRSGAALPPALVMLLVALVGALLDGGLTLLLDTGSPLAAALLGGSLCGVSAAALLAWQRAAAPAPAVRVEIAAVPPPAIVAPAPDAAAEARRAQIAAVVRRLTERLRAAADGIAERGRGVELAVGSSFQRMDAIAALAAQSSINVQAVSGATEQLTASVVEVGNQMGRSADIAGQAGDEITRATAEVGELTSTAEKINSVVQLIRKIAGHTNLLALNATIEAARAGEAGRGFAVVAAEVKALATQTAQATVEIESQIKSIQDSTLGVHRVIGTVSDTITSLQAITVSIAAAVDLQLATTRKIAGSVGSVATDIGYVSENMAGIVDSSRDIRGLSGKMLAASAALAGSADEDSSEAERLLAA